MRVSESHKSWHSLVWLSVTRHYLGETTSDQNANKKWIEFEKKKNGEKLLTFQRKAWEKITQSSIDLKHFRMCAKKIEFIYRSQAVKYSPNRTDQNFYANSLAIGETSRLSAPMQAMLRPLDQRNSKFHFTRCECFSVHLNDSNLWVREKQK